MYTTPGLKSILTHISRFGLKVAGWKLVGVPPTEKRYVLIAVPHTSNWDFPITLAMAFVFDFKLYWFGKHSLFRGILGPIMRWLGGIAVERSQANNLVDNIIKEFKNADELVVAIQPEGTRSKVNQWKTGFYHIAVGANVPIALGFLDFKKKEGGFLPTFYPTGDMEKDITAIQGMYRGIAGKYADQSHLS